MNPDAGDVGEPRPAGGPWAWAIVWTVVFAANLMFPLSLGWTVTADGGRAGIGGAVATFWVLGLLAATQGRRVAWAMIWGGALMAASQVVPVLHIIAGQIALGIWSGNSSMTRRAPLSEAGGFGVTMMTGGPLFVIAVVYGLVLGRLFGGRRAG